jgi:hypothetical protein
MMSFHTASIRKGNSKKFLSEFIKKGKLVSLKVELDKFNIKFMK